MLYFLIFLRKSLFLMGVEQNSTSHLEKLISAVGAFLGICAVWWVSYWYLDQQGAVMMIASMGASAVLLFAVPHGVLSQPWAVIGGHLISAFVGIACFKLLGASPWTPPLAVGLAVAAMHYFSCIHPPGGATALTAVIGGDAVYSAGFGLMVYPVLINVVAIIFIAVTFNCLFKWRLYPARLAQHNRPSTAPTSDHAVTLTHEDFAAAMQELNSLIDVTSTDLAHLFELAVTHAEHNAAHPTTISAGGYYSNGRLGKHWSIRQVIDVEDASAPAAGKLIYKTLAGDGAYEVGICAAEEFRRWARFEVEPSNGHWLRIDSNLTVCTAEQP